MRSALGEDVSTIRVSGWDNDSPYLFIPSAYAGGTDRNFALARFDAALAYRLQSGNEINEKPNQSWYSDRGEIQTPHTSMPVFVACDHGGKSASRAITVSHRRRNRTIHQAD